MADAGQLQPWLAQPKTSAISAVPPLVPNILRPEECGILVMPANLRLQPNPCTAQPRSPRRIILRYFELLWNEPSLADSMGKPTWASIEGEDSPTWELETWESSSTTNRQSIMRCFRSWGNPLPTPGRRCCLGHQLTRNLLLDRGAQDDRQRSFRSVRTCTDGRSWREVALRHASKASILGIQACHPSFLVICTGWKAAIESSSFRT